MKDMNRAIIQACSVNGEICRNGKRDDFKINPETGEKFLCNKWISMRGKDPESEELIDNWMCNEFAIPKLLSENAQRINQLGASTDKVANEVRKHHESFVVVATNKVNQRLLDAEQKTNLIEKGA